MTTQCNYLVSPSSPTEDAFMNKLKAHAARAEEFSSAVLKQRIAVPSPQGGYRMEVQIIRRSR